MTIHEYECECGQRGQTSAAYVTCPHCYRLFYLTERKREWWEKAPWA